MATNRYINIINGMLQQVVPTVVSAGAANSGQLVALTAAGVLDTTVMPAGIGATAVTATASATISAGMGVNVYNNAGVLSVRPSDNTAVGSEANGYAPAAITSGASGTVNLGSGIITGLSGLTIGSQYFLGTVGAFTTTVPATAGNVIQKVGKALSATSIDFVPASEIVVVA